MKLTTLLLIIALVQASAKSYSQVTLHVKNAPLKQVLKSIELQTGYGFIYNEEKVNLGNISVELKNATMDEALNQCFKDIPVTYKIVDKNIVLQPADVSFFDKLKAAVARVTVQGKVVDQNGQPMPGVTVKIKGSNNGVITDDKGFFAISAPDNSAIITFTFIGYGVKALSVADVNGKVVVLEVSMMNLKEIVVNKGYYNTTKALNTGDVGGITADEIAKQPTNNALVDLTGRVAGVFVTQSSGLPNSTVKIQIRGTNSLAQGTDPLYVIDGVPYAANLLPNVGSSGAGDASPFSFINPASIESVDVLKDADATAIYGSRGANGVVLITTKKGKAGAVKFDANLYTGISKIPATAKLLNRDQYLQMRYEAFKNSGAVKSTTNAPDLLLWDTSRNENWQKRLLDHITLNTDAQLSMSGGNENTSYRIFGGYNRTTPPFPGSFKSDKLSGGMSLSTASVNKRFNLQASVNYMVDNTFLPSYNPVSGILLAPVAPEPFNPDGTMNYKDYSTNNPFPGFLNPYIGKVNNLVTSMVLSYRFFNSLLLKVNGGYNNNTVNGDYQYTIASQIGSPFISTPAPTSSFSTNNINSWIIEPQLSYSGNIANGKLEALVGSTFQESNTSGQLLYASGYTSDAQLPSIASATSIFNQGSTLEQSKFTSLYARINYNYQDEYLINMVGRRDGSSRFGPDKKFGNFGSVGLAWIFSKEKLIADNLPFLSFGKLRGSYGITGNEPGTNYGYLQLYNFYTTTGRPYQTNAQALTPANLLSPDYAWEQVAKLEGGLELGFLKNRVMFSASYFRNKSSNQLVQYQLPAITGSVSVLLNRPATIQNTGLEFTASTKNIQTSSFSWSSGFNITASRNKLVSYPNFATSSYASTLVIGQPLNVIMAYRAAGVDPQTGVYQFYDQNGKLTFNPALTDRTQYLSTDPKFYGGLSNTFTYKSFSLDVFLQFVKQLGVNYYYINSELPGRSYYGDGNQPTAVLDRWQKPGDIKPFQQFNTSSVSAAANAYYYQQHSDAGYTDASYIRLKNVSLSYRLPQNFLHKLNIDQTRFYFQAQNLYTFTKYKGLDPEGQGTTPPLSIWTMGAQFTF